MWCCTSRATELAAAHGARHQEPLRRGRRGRLFSVARQRDRGCRRPVRPVPGSAAEPVPGTAITVTLDGKRPLVGEVQALLATPSGGSPRRAVSGIDSRPGRDDHRGAGEARQAEDRRQRHLPVDGRRHAADRPVVGSGGRGRDRVRLHGHADADDRGGDRRGGPGRRSTAGGGMERRLAEAARLGFTSRWSRRVRRVPPGLRVLPAPTIVAALETCS